jgi:hypothetical protein
MVQGTALESRTLLGIRLSNVSGVFLESYELDVAYKQHSGDFMHICPSKDSHSILCPNFRNSTNVKWTKAHHKQSRLQAFHETEERSASRTEHSE